MKLTPFLPITLAALAVATPSWTLSIRRTSDKGPALVADVSKLSAAVKTLNKTLNTFGPDELLGLLTAEQIQQQTGALNKDIQAATKVATASGKFSGGNSLNIAEAILTLQPEIASVLNNIVRHKPSFATAVLFVGDLSQTVEADLVQQRNLTSAFAAAVTLKLKQPYRGLAPTFTNQILGYFDNAIAAYQKCTGLVCLPPINLS